MRGSHGLRLQACMRGECASILLSSQTVVAHKPYGDTFKNMHVRMCVPGHACGQFCRCKHHPCSRCCATLTWCDKLALLFLTLSMGRPCLPIFPAAHRSHKYIWPDDSTGWDVVALSDQFSGFSGRYEVWGLGIMV